MFDEVEALTWLEVIYRNAPGLLHICATGDWHGETFDNDEDGRRSAVAYAADLDAQGREGVYARVTTLKAPLPGNTRGGVGDSRAFCAFWADVDLAGPGHASPPAGAGRLPADEQEGRHLVTATGLPEPSLWVHSGGGLYPIWLLDQPQAIADDTVLAELVETSALWQKVIGAAGDALDLHYGTGVGDLARVLRLPGSTNRKVGLRRGCRILTEEPHDATRYPLMTLHAAGLDAAALLLPDPAPPATVTLPRAASGFACDGDISPGNDFEARADWSEILQPHGWRQVWQRGDIRYWRRPGKRTAGISATTNVLGTDRLRVFSTAAAPFETRSYGKLGALAALEHGGDLSAAAKALRARGYGHRAATDPDWPASSAAVLGKRSPVDAPIGRPIRDVHLPPGSDEDPGRCGQDTTGPFTPAPPPGPPGPSGPGRAPAAPAPAAGAPGTPTAAPAPVTATPGAPDPLLAEVRYREEVAAEARRLRIRREAKERLDAEDYEATWREPPSTLTLTQELEKPDEPVAYRVAELLPTGGNAILAAQFKAGKTTLCNDLVRALADGEPFLSRFGVELPPGRVALFNYEVGEGQYRQWLRTLGIEATDRVCVLNVRGYRLPPTIAQVETWITKWLADRDVSVWVVDPFAAAFGGCGEENSNSDVGQFLASLDVIKERAGVGELILPVHTGRAEQENGQERARGASRLDDWADARWLLTTDDQGRRYLRATGRDVEVAEELISLDPATRRLRMGGWDRPGMERRDLVDEVVTYVAENPGQGANEIVDGVIKRRAAVLAALQQAIGEGRIFTHDGGNRKRLHYVVGALPRIEEDN